MKNVTFVGERIDNGKDVFGHYFKTPLTAENFEADSFQSGKVRHCISDENGVVFEIVPDSHYVCDIDGTSIASNVSFSNGIPEDY